ncbi:DUF559 domain-containing protein [Jiangella asiatica]|uniref:DUF559 domain-containing protein n=1 Tax=Jiangella asiatica TaxID=2530372 RepID=A0A4R5CH21_9ACTN|nr:DUF559 domain-containing protein [Jiangella asiatica]TDD99025.1 DUF559 domain-containing protein [Jiangella asiatica]
MPRLVHLPPPFHDAPFLVTEARRVGVPKGVLDGTRFRAPVRGVRVPADHPTSLRAACQAVGLALPTGAAFSHETAALLCDLPVPRFDGRIDVMVEPGAVVPRIRGTEGHVGLDPATVINVGGIALVHPRRAFFQVAAGWRVDDLVVLGDAILRRWCSPDDLADEAARHARRRGIVRAREALRLVRPGVDSPMESRLRLLIVRAGLPFPVVGFNVIDDTGSWLARPDLAYPDLRIAIEYDGDHHRTDRRQWRRDRFRDESMRDAGWIVITLTAEDVLHHAGRTVERIRRHVRSRLIME